MPQQQPDFIIEALRLLADEDVWEQLPEQSKIMLSALWIIGDDEHPRANAQILSSGHYSSREKMLKTMKSAQAAAQSILDIIEEGDY